MRDVYYHCVFLLNPLQPIENIIRIAFPAWLPQYKVISARELLVLNNGTVVLFYTCYIFFCLNARE